MEEAARRVEAKGLGRVIYTILFFFFFKKTLPVCVCIGARSDPSLATYSMYWRGTASFPITVFSLLSSRSVLFPVFTLSCI